MDQGPWIVLFRSWPRLGVINYEVELFHNWKFEVKDWAEKWKIKQSFVEAGNIVYEGTYWWEQWLYSLNERWPLIVDNGASALYHAALISLEVAPQ